MFIKLIDENGEVVLNTDSLSWFRDYTDENAQPPFNKGILAVLSGVHPGDNWEQTVIFHGITYDKLCSLLDAKQT